MKLVILTGAGISAPAGIPTFQELYKPILEDSQRTDEEKAEALMFKGSDLMAILGFRKFEPTRLHWIIGRLAEDPDINLTVFTTNVDDLHEQTYVDAYHIHGTMSDPVLFGGHPRFIDEYLQAIQSADYLIVIGSQLAYPYLSMPIMEFCFQNPARALLLDTDSNHPFSSSFAHINDEDEFENAIDWLLSGKCCEQSYCRACDHGT